MFATRILGRRCGLCAQSTVDEKIRRRIAARRAAAEKAAAAAARAEAAVADDEASTDVRADEFIFFGAKLFLD